jgi:hypothetical protein
MTVRQIEKATRGERDVVRGDPKKKKRPKKSARQRAVKYANDMFSLYIKARDKRCVTCGKTTDLQCSHIFQGRHESTRWRDDCAYTQCKGCHHDFHMKSNLPLLRYAERKVGRDWLDHLWTVNNRTAKMTTDQIEMSGKGYAEKVEAMK